MFEFGGTTNQRSALPAELWPQVDLARELTDNLRLILGN